MLSKIDEITIKNELLETNIKVERVEVMLSNLLALKVLDDESFVIPMDDVFVTLETAIALLRN